MNEDYLDFTKWVIGILVAGYPFLAGLIIFLIRELIRANKDSMRIIQEATIHSKDLRTALEKTNCVVDKVVDLLN